MRVLLILLLLLSLYCVIGATTNEETPTDVVLGTHEKPSSFGSLGSMWTAVRQHLGNLSFNKPAAATPVVVVNKTEVREEDDDNDTTSLNQDKLPSQMAPIEKALIYTRPKANERWILKEEGLITWAVSSYLQSKADEIFMNCNLYMDDKMIMSVFKGVPLAIGTESWTPPVFLEPSPNYRLRLWSQPSQIGIIDEYSALFSIVPRREDAFMFSYNKSVVFDNNSNNNTAVVPTAKMRVGHKDLLEPSASEKHGIIIDVNSTPSSLNVNMPTGIYTLYPSNANTNYVNGGSIWIVSSVVLFYVINIII